MSATLVVKFLTLDFVKVKGYSDNYYNNYIDEYISHTDENSESNLQKFLKEISILQNWEKFLNLNRNEEIPTIEKRKYILIVYLKIGNVYFVKKFFEETCNYLLIEANKDPIVDDELIDKMIF
ncbi:hypothetical protein C1646_755053 [Rhizophagus diaphanus]|nr:hypothetical protein C1646_755053 [Rhizophagus diaphanus] [Rhizophagus sp. MUCL 43196]